MCKTLKQFQPETISLSVTRSVCHYLATITSFDPVSDPTPAAVVAEIDEDSAFYRGARQSSGAVVARKRQSMEMNASDPVREDGVARTTLPCLVATAGSGTQVEDDIGDLDETQVQEPGSKRRQKEGNDAKDLLDQLIEARCAGAGSAPGGARGGTECGCCRGPS